MQLLGEDKVVEQMTATTGSEDVHLLKGDNEDVLVDMVAIVGKCQS